MKRIDLLEILMDSVKDDRAKEGIYATAVALELDRVGTLYGAWYKDSRYIGRLEHLGALVRLATDFDLPDQRLTFFYGEPEQDLLVSGTGRVRYLNQQEKSHFDAGFSNPERYDDEISQHRWVSVGQVNALKH